MGAEGWRQGICRVLEIPQLGKQQQQQSMVGELEKMRCEGQVSRGGALLALQINSACPQTFSACDTIQWDSYWLRKIRPPPAPVPPMRTYQGDIIEQRVTQRLLRNAVLHWRDIAADRKEKEERLKATLARTRVDLLVRPGSDQQVWEKCDVGVEVWG